MIKILFFLTVYCWTVSGMAQSYFRADLQAKTATYQEAKTPQSLVSFLTTGLSSDTEKARAIATWMVYQLERNGYRDRVLIKASNQNTPAPQLLPNDIFITRIGTPQEFATLFNKLATLAGLKSTIITGYAGEHISAPRAQKPLFVAVQTALQFLPQSNYALQRYEAAWNAVFVDNRWHLIDTYWMIADTTLFGAQGVNTERDMRNFLKRRTKRLPSLSALKRGKEIDDRYFYAKPNFMIKTHFPLDSFWQFITPPRRWSTFSS